MAQPIFNKILPISALVVSHNEEHILENCLKSIKFCDEIFLIDLESSDNSLKIGSKYATNVISEKKVDTVEELFETYIKQLKNDWVMLIDPDEVIDYKLYLDITDFFLKIPENCGKINVPIQYYFKKQALKGTVWGGYNKTGRLLIKQSGTLISSSIHVGINLKDEYLTYKIKRKGNNVDHHYWAESFEKMLEKHKRYTKKEGLLKFKKGVQYNYIIAIKKTVFNFYECYFTYKGYLDGFLGIGLSLFYGWYEWETWKSLKKLHRSKSK